MKNLHSALIVDVFSFLICMTYITIDVMQSTPSTLCVFLSLSEKMPNGEKQSSHYTIVPV